MKPARYSLNKLQGGFAEQFSSAHGAPMLCIHETGMASLLAITNDQGLPTALEIIEDQCDLIGAYQGSKYIIKFPRMMPDSYSALSLELELRHFISRRSSTLALYLAPALITV